MLSRHDATGHARPAGKAAGEGAPSQKTCRASAHSRTPRGRRIQVLRIVASSSPAPSWRSLAVLVSGGRRRRRRTARPRSRSRSPPPPARSRSQKTPARIVSLSPTATESLFAIGAGTQVVAVDDQSDYPKSAPKTTLSGFTPNVEAIAAYRPDLVVVSYDPKGLVRRLKQARDPGASCTAAATTLPGAYQQIRQLGHRRPATRPEPTRVIARHEDARSPDRQGVAAEGGRSLRLPRADARLLLGDVEARSSGKVYDAARPARTSPTPPTRPAPGTRSSRRSTSSPRAPT